MLILESNDILITETGQVILLETESETEIVIPFNVPFKSMLIMNETSRRIINPRPTINYEGRLNT